MRQINILNINRNSNEQHPYHLVNTSPWPLFTAVSLGSCALSFLLYFNYYKNSNLYIVLSLVFFCFFLTRWFIDVIIESTYEGHHTVKVQNGIRFAFILFILSEVMFFSSFFWGFLHCSLNAAVDIGSAWPPKKIITLDPWGLPLVNTIILLSSGITITWSHKAIIDNNRKSVIYGILSTVLYGLLFSLIQYYEYLEAPFNINDSIYGSLFFLLTGFHGAHVLVGSIFLFVCLLRQW
jgi:heme/copper-type cytochrome/quinol oxidase subunit 3